MKSVWGPSRHSCKGGSQVASRHMKGSPASLLTRKMQIQCTMNETPSSCLSAQPLSNERQTRCSAETLDPLYTVGGNIKWDSSWKLGQCRDSLRNEHYNPTWDGSPALSVHSNWRQNIEGQFNTPMFISALLMVAQMYKGPNDRRLVDKENMVYIHTVEYYSASNGKQSLLYAWT